MRNFLTLVFMSLAALTVAACSGEDAAAPAPQAQESKGSTNLSVDTKDGSFSYEESDGGNNTSISVGDKNDKGN